MFSIPSFYELGTCSDSYNDILHQGVLSSPTDHHINQELSPRSMAEAKAMAASNSHKEAERRRRKRINTHIATLKSILPNTIKTDKASLLGEAVKRVRELKKTTAELTASMANEKEPNNDDINPLSNINSTSKLIMVPSETDELKLCRCEANSDLIRATMSCDDRPDMILDLIQALKSAQAKVVRAEMSTVGGRTKSILWVKMMASSSSSTNNESDVGLEALRRALRMVMDKSTLLEGSGQGLPGNKRPCYYHL